MEVRSLSEAAENSINGLRFSGAPRCSVSDAADCGRVRSSVRFLLHELKSTEKRILATITKAEILHARLQGGKHGRPRSMTPERIAVATAMAEAGQSGQIVWKTLAAMQGPQIGRSAYYLWLKEHCAPKRMKNFIPQKAVAARSCSSRWRKASE